MPGRLMYVPKVTATGGGAEDAARLIILSLALVRIGILPRHELHRQSFDLMLSALPGLREVRAPLAAGYLWLLNLWLITHADEARSSSLSHSFIELGELTGAVSLSVAIGFGAYLLGSLTEGALLFLIASVTELRVSNRGLATLESIVARETEGAYAPSLAPQELAREFHRRRTTRRRFGSEPSLDDTESDSEATARQRLEELFVEELLEDLDLVKTRLLEHHREVFSVSDRLNSEADLRFAVIPPLLLLAGVIANRAETWWLFLVFLVPICLLGIQAWARKRRGGDVLADALGLRLVEAPASEDFALSIGELEAR